MLFILPFLAQIEAETNVTQKSIWGLLWDSSAFVKITLLILLFFSVVSWAIIFYKYRQLRDVQTSSQDFWAAFAQAKSIAGMAESRHPRKGPLAEIFNTALELMPRIKKGKATGLQRTLITQKINQTQEEEIYKLEQYIPFLATTASTTPFIGLFGTVWGILTAFWAIGKAGSSSLATVGPYISEALITTAIGLAAAIPAVIAYNFFVHRIKVLTKMMDLFADDVALKLEEELIS